MDADPTLRRALLGILMLGVVAAGIATTAGLVLAKEYRPSVAAPVGSIASHGAAWQMWHQLATSVLLLCGVGGFSLALRRSRVGGPSKRQLAVGLVGSTVSVAAAATALLTQRRVDWDRLLQFRVMSGPGVSGYWNAAFDSSVRAVIVQDALTSPSHYRLTLLVFLAAPAVALVALVAVAVVAWRPAVIEPAASAVAVH